MICFEIYNTMITLRHHILFMTYLMCSNSLKITRHLQDEINYDADKCWKIRAMTIDDNCVCERQCPTAMSNNFEHYSCHTPSELKCEISLVKKGTVYLVKGNSYFQETVPHLNEGCRAIHAIYVWNLRPNSYQSIWVNVTKHTLGNILLNRNSEVNIIDFDNKLWRGQLFKVEFGCGKCALVKVFGGIIYPFDTTQFESDVITPQPPPTSKALPSTQTPTPGSRETPSSPPPPSPPPPQISTPASKQTSLSPAKSTRKVPPTPTRKVPPTPTQKVPPTPTRHQHRHRKYHRHRHGNYHQHRHRKYHQHRHGKYHQHRHRKYHRHRHGKYHRHPRLHRY